jgi:uncharacterized membrane protein
MGWVVEAGTLTRKVQRERIVSADANMNQQTLTLVGAFSGGALGILGGFVGTYFSIRNTKGPRERNFVVRSAVVFGLGVSAFLAALFVTPMPYASLLWLPYMAALLFVGRAWNRRQRQIRSEESSASSQNRPE